MLKATFRQLEVFLAVAQRGSFTAAAEALDVSQAAISKQIAALEKNMGCRLFERRAGAHSPLSAEGAKLAAQVPALMRPADAIASIASLDRSPPPTVRVGCGDMIARMILSRVDEFYLRNPGLEIEVCRMDPDSRSVNQLARKKIDLAYFTFLGPQTYPGGTLLREVESGIYISPTCPSAETWKPNTSESLPVISSPRGSAVDVVFHGVLANAGITNFHIVARVPSVEVLTRMAVHGVGAICAPCEEVRQEVESGQLKKLPLPAQTLHRYKFVQQGLSAPNLVREVDQFISSLL